MSDHIPRLIVALVAIAAVAVGCGGDENEDGDGTEAASTLFVQTADGGSFKGSGENVTLTLEGVAPATTTFSDRPERDSSAIPTADLVAEFEEFFGTEPPNATVSSLERGPGEFPVELTEPRYDPKAGMLTYAVTPIGEEEPNLPPRLGPVSVFIDGGHHARAKSTRTGDLVVNVTDSTDWDSIAGAEVDVELKEDSQGDEGSGNGKTDADGSVEFDDLDRGTWSITATFPGYETQTVTKLIDNSVVATTIELVCIAGPAGSGGGEEGGIEIHDPPGAVVLVQSRSGQLENVCQ